MSPTPALTRAKSRSARPPLPKREQAAKRHAKKPNYKKAPADQVDVIIAQWQRERPDLDPAPMRLLGLLAQAHAAMTPFMTQAVAPHGLARGTFDVLCALRRAGPPFALTPKQLADSLMLSGAGMTSRLDRLQTDGLIDRIPDPSDRRSLKVQLTARGRKLIDGLIPQVVATQWQLVSDLGLRDTDMLIKLLGRLTMILAGDESAGGFRLKN